MRIKSFLALVLIAGAFRQTPASFAVRGHMHPLAQARFDRGQVGDLFQMNYVMMMFKPTAEQRDALNSLLKEQQDPSSPNYHRWLTPEEFGDRFGMSTADLNRVTTWLQERGFTLHELPPSRNWVAFTATAGQMRDAFNLRIHEYFVNGEMHYAAANEPMLPAGFVNRVLGFRALHNFRVKSRLVRAKFTDTTTGSHAIAPDDFATIYNVHAAYNSGLTGAGQHIAVMGQTDIQVQDIRAFRAA